MEIEALASGSSGNVTAIRTLNGELVLIDCGKSFAWTMARLDYELPDALLITHEHGDHSRAVKQFLSKAVEVFMTAGTRDALNLEPSRNLHILTKANLIETADAEFYDGVRFHIGGSLIGQAIPSTHDAKEPVNFILEDAQDRVLFVTDTGALPKVRGDFTKIFIEANYDTRELMWSDLPHIVKERILNNHLPIESVEKFLAKYPNAEKTLLHISKRHGNEAEFYRRINHESESENPLKPANRTGLESTLQSSKASGKTSEEISASSRENPRT